jgi:hypothetical protein
MTYSKNEEKRAEKRRLKKTEVTFHTEDDIYMANSIDISDRGIRIVTDEPVEIRIQIKEEDKLVQYEAQLVWTKVNEDGTMEYGLKY